MALCPAWQTWCVLSERLCVLAAVMLHTALHLRGSTELSASRHSADSWRLCHPVNPLTWGQWGRCMWGPVPRWNQLDPWRVLVPCPSKAHLLPAFLSLGLCITHTYSSWSDSLLPEELLECQDQLWPSKTPGNWKPCWTTDWISWWSRWTQQIWGTLVVMVFGSSISWSWSLCFSATSLCSPRHLVLLSEHCHWRLVWLAGGLLSSVLAMCS